RSNRASCNVQRGTCNGCGGAVPWRRQRCSSSRWASTVFYRPLPPLTARRGRAGRRSRPTSTGRRTSSRSSSRRSAGGCGPRPSRSSRGIWGSSTPRLPSPGPADLEVHVPRALTVWVTTTGADIDVVGVDGKLDLTSVGGAIHVVGTPQDVTAETMNGSVELAGGTGRARVKTVSGDILLRGASQDLGASTLSGRIVVRAAGWQRGGTGVQRGKFESVTGDVRFEGELGRGGVLEVESQSGTIEVRVPSNTVADFDVRTIRGAITNHLGDARPQRRAA